MALNHTQSLVFELLKQSPLQDRFYWTGGTLLSEKYLHHRESYDIDLVSEKPFRYQDISPLLQALQKQARLNKIEEKKIFDRFEFFLHNRDEVRLEFAHYDHPALKKRQRWNGILVDSLEDLAANKTMALVDRREPKDVIDVYFLIHKGYFSTKRLLHLAAKKFGVTIDESTFFSEAMKSLKHLHTLQPILFGSPYEQKKIMNSIQQYFEDQSSEFIHSYWH